MPTITYSSSDGSEHACPLDAGQSVLEGLEFAGVSVPNSCRAGVCQSCLMKCSSGAIPPVAQKGLKDSLKARAYFLACVCRPTEDMVVHPAEHAAQRARAIVHLIEKLSPDVARVLLSYERPFDYFPGQFVNLVRSDGLMRSYSLANVRPATEADEDLLELHVRKVADGQMSNWLHDQAKPGDVIDLRGPQGDCFYTAGQPEQPILLAGTGTGLAPLYAIVRDALQQGHTGPIHLYHGARDAGGLYLVNELIKLAERHPNFSYLRCLVTGEEESGVKVGALNKVVLGDLPNLKGWRVFLCGNPGLVNLLRKAVFLAGANMKEIYSDAFVMRAPA